MQADLLEYLTESERKEFAALLSAMPVWMPDPRNKPQCAAYESDADVIGYGGSAGSGKTDLLLGFAGTKHYRSIIFRRVFPLLEAIEARSRDIFKATHAARGKDSYNESLHRWELNTGATVRFAAMQYEEDKKNFQGRPFDFYGFDEATEFTESQFRFVTGWNRSTRGGQKCRILMVFNPPFDEEGEWVVNYFAPWLDDKHPNPAKDGELRWYSFVDGKEIECKGGTPFYNNGEMITPRSRTFFYAQLSDNKFLADTGYGAIIDAMPEPMRSLLRGKFGAYRINELQIFTNWKVADLSNPSDEYYLPEAQRTNRRNGLDFGFSSNPAAIGVSHYDKMRKRIYIFDELYETGLTNDLLADEIKRMIGNERIICDSAEPKSIQELKNKGVNSVAAKKGKDSVNFGIDWLRQHEIIVHKDCINAIKELKRYKWKVGADGKPVSPPKPVDANNHFIDGGLRYAYEDDMQRKLVRAF